MTNYIGHKVKLASRHFYGGLISPHIRINWTNNGIYFYERFDEGNGIAQPESENEVNNIPNTREWYDVQSVCYDKSPEEMRDIALHEAEKRNVVLIEHHVFEEGKLIDRITWHPDGWEPQDTIYQ